MTTPINEPLLLSDAQRALQQNAAKALQEKIKKRKKLYQNLLSDQKTCHDTIAKGPDLELLKHNLHRIKRGDTSIDVMDYQTEPPTLRHLPLPNTPAKEVVAKGFLAIKRAMRGLVHLAPRLSSIAQEIADLEKELAHILSVEFFLQEGVKPPIEAVLKKASKKPPIRLPYKIFTSKDGILLWVAKSAKDGDQMTLKHSRGNEWWLHIKDNVGAHVLVKYSQVIPKETLLDAAHLALHFSKAKGEPKGEVLYTQVKHLKKLKGMKAGQISVQREKTIYIILEQSRLERLFSNASLAH